MHLGKPKKVLVLNSDYMPLGIIGWKRAICLHFVGQEIPEEGVSVVEYYSGVTITSGGGIEHPLPAVVASNRYINRSKFPPSFTKRNIILRDQLSCQYCGIELKKSEATIDHVLPRAQWKLYPEKRKNNQTPTHWENVVACCFDCNHKKGSKTPKQAGMSLINEPTIPDGNRFVAGMSPYEKVPDVWKPYLKASVFEKLLDRM